MLREKRCNKGDLVMSLYVRLVYWSARILNEIPFVSYDRGLNSNKCHGPVGSDLARQIINMP